MRRTWALSGRAGALAILLRGRRLSSIGRVWTIVRPLRLCGFRSARTTLIRPSLVALPMLVGALGLSALLKLVLLRLRLGTLLRRPGRAFALARLAITLLELLRIPAAKFLALGTASFA